MSRLIWSNYWLILLSIFVKFKLLIIRFELVNWGFSWLINLLFKFELFKLIKFVIFKLELSNY